MFLQNWYPRETSLLFTCRQMLCSMSVRKCIRFCIPVFIASNIIVLIEFRYNKTIISCTCGEQL